MFPASIVSLICEYNDCLPNAGSVWMETVDLLKRDGGETKFGCVPFPEALIQLIGEHRVGDRAYIEEQSQLWGPPAGLRYRRVIRAEHHSPYDSIFVVPRDATLNADGSNWRVRYNMLLIDGFDSIDARADYDSDEEPKATYVEFANDHGGVLNDLMDDSEGDEYEEDPDFDHEAKPEAYLVCLRCEVSCSLLMRCAICGEDMCHKCQNEFGFCGTCPVDLWFDEFCPNRTVSGRL